MTQDKMRAEFEAWALTQIKMLLYQSETYHGEYGCEITQIAWEVWQAAQKREPLSENEIDEIVLSTYASVSESDAFSIVRATEAAHNITKEQP